LANFWVAQIFLKKGDKERATAFYKKSLNRAPTFFSSLYAVGELSFVKGDTTTAAAYYEAALKVKKDTGLLIKLGLLNEYNKKYKKASKLYQEAIDLSPDNFIGYNQLAWLYAKRGINLDRAMKYAEKANSLQPGNVSILDTIGWIYYHKKDFKKSLKNLEKSYSISSNNPTVLYHLGIVHNHLGDRSSSKKFLTRALEISGTFEEAADARKQLANL
jgi:tetratricopeptide (TPR) repeat protein